MGIKLLAFDLDGTTITEHKYLSRENREQLERAGRAGVHLVPATGRMLSFLPQEITALPGVEYAITANGSAVYRLGEEKAVYQRLITNRKARQVQQVLDGYDIYIEYYKDGGAITKRGFPQLAKTHFAFPRSKWHFIEGKDYILADDLGKMLEETGLCPEKINLPYLSQGLRAELWDKLTALGGLRLTSSIPDNIEINDALADKGAALLELARRLGIKREEIMAMGDNGNDVTMLEAAGCSVAVADGAEQALAAARYITAAHHRDGVAQGIRRFIFGEE